MLGYKLQVSSLLQYNNYHHFGGFFNIIQYNAYLDGNHAWLFGLNLSVFLKSGVSINWWWTLTPIPGAIPMHYSYGSS